jgi:hypothetical protein
MAFSQNQQANNQKRPRSKKKMFRSTTAVAALLLCCCHVTHAQPIDCTDYIEPFIPAKAALTFNGTCDFGATVQLSLTLARDGGGTLKGAYTNATGGITQIASSLRGSFAAIPVSRDDGTDLRAPSPTSGFGFCAPWTCPPGSWRGSTMPKEGLAMTLHSDPCLWYQSSETGMMVGIVQLSDILGICQISSK